MLCCQQVSVSTSSDNHYSIITQNSPISRAQIGGHEGGWYLSRYRDKICVYDKHLIAGGGKLQQYPVNKISSWTQII